MRDIGNYPILAERLFPFLFGGTFIEGPSIVNSTPTWLGFPFLFGGTFIEGIVQSPPGGGTSKFPFLFGGTFIEGAGLVPVGLRTVHISLPFRRDFH